VTLFAPWKLRNVTAPNRLVRSATYEGLGDREGRPSAELGRLYARLAAGDVGTIVTGFCYVSCRGRAMQPGQCGIDRDELVPAWTEVVRAVRAVRPDCLLVMQLAHAGRQTLESAAGGPVLAPSDRRSPYFRSRPKVMDEADIAAAVSEFACAARRARQAGFDGVQVHAAHGYLVHQFLSPFTNCRRDGWGRDRFAFAAEVIGGIKRACGDAWPVFVKLSAADENPGGMTPELAAGYAARMAALGVEAVEVSVGTMDLALNIFRGGAPLELVMKHNPLFCRRPAWLRALWKLLVFPRMRRRLLPFAEGYNREAARLIRDRSGLPVVLVGGLRSLPFMEEVLALGDADALALCRPLVREPDLAARFRRGQAACSLCTNCNACAVMCDSAFSLRCYARKEDRS
jgi:2,4-dienoyl-CoA reductase-like NADH-dependent reductase (Old Yellow Enzyme family)